MAVAPLHVSQAPLLHKSSSLFPLSSEIEFVISDSELSCFYANTIVLQMQAFLSFIIFFYFLYI